MASGNVEVEIKLELSQEKFNEIRKRLLDEAEFLSSVINRDEYFTPVENDFMSAPHPYQWLSIRERGGSVTLSYKHGHPEDSSPKTHFDEFEPRLYSNNDADLMRKVLERLGYRSMVMVENKRETYILDEDFEIAMDIVTDLGHFMEIEARKDFGGVDSTRERLFEVAARYGLGKENLAKGGYPPMLMRKKGILK